MSVHLKGCYIIANVKGFTLISDGRSYGILHDDELIGAYNNKSQAQLRFAELTQGTIAAFLMSALDH